MVPATTPRSPLPRAVLLLGAASFFTDVASEMILPLIPALLLGTLGATPLWLGAVDGIADALAAVLKQKAGALSDRSASRKPWVLAGYGLSTLARPLVTFASAPVHVLLVRSLDRVGKGVRTAPRDALLAEAVVPADAPRAFALHRMMDHAGAVVGPLVASGLLAWGLSVRAVIAWAWVPGLCAFLVLLLVRERARTRGAAHEKGSVPLEREVRRFLLAVFVLGVGLVPDTFLLVRARELHAPDALLPLMWVVLHVAKVMAAGAVARRAHTHVSVLLIGWALVALGACALAIPTMAAVWGSAVLVGLGHGVREPLEKEVVRRSAPLGSHGSAFGRYHLVAGFASLAGGLAVGALWTAFGVRGALPLIVGAAVAAALLAGPHVRGAGARRS